MLVLPRCLEATKLLGRKIELWDWRQHWFGFSLSLFFSFFQKNIACSAALPSSCVCVFMGALQSHNVESRVAHWSNNCGGGVVDFSAVSFVSERAANVLQAREARGFNHVLFSCDCVFVADRSGVAGICASCYQSYFLVLANEVEFD